MNLISLDRARVPKLHARTRQRRQTTAEGSGADAATDTLRPIHESVGIVRRSSIDHVADVVLVDAFDLHAWRRHAQAGEMDDVVVVIVKRAHVCWGGVCLHAVDGLWGEGDFRGGTRDGEVAGGIGTASLARHVWGRAAGVGGW